MESYKKPLIGWLVTLVVCSVGALLSVDRARAAAPAQLERGIQKAEVVARVRIKRIIPETYVDQSQNVLCGTTYLVDVLKMYKGDSLDELSFSAFGSPLAHQNFDVREADEMLVMLSRRMSDDDPVYLSNPDAILGPPSRNKLSCLLRLAKFGLNFGLESALLLRERPDIGKDSLIPWLLYDGERTQLPKSVKDDNVQLYSEACINPDGECIKDPKRWVRWTALEREVAKAAKK